MIDLKIQYLGFSESPAISEIVREHVDRLEKLNDKVISCHVIISKPHRKHHQGNTYQVKLRIHLAGTNIIIDKDPGKNHAHEDIRVTIRDAFLAAKRKVEDFSKIRSGLVKEKVRPLHAKILRVLPAEDCGFVLSEDQRELYFHRNALLNGKFDSLHPGQEVRFSETLGDNGPQISSMEVVGQSGHIVPI